MMGAVISIVKSNGALIFPMRTEVLMVCDFTQVKIDGLDENSPKIGFSTKPFRPRNRHAPRAMCTHKNGRDRKWSRPLRRFVYYRMCSS